MDLIRTIVAGGALLAVATATQAATIITTYNGDILSGEDPLALFTPSGVLSGNITITFITADLVLATSGDYGEDSHSATTATMMLYNRQFSFGAPAESFSYAFNNGNEGQISVSTANGSGGISADAFSPALSNSLTTAFLPILVSGFGSFEVYSSDGSTTLASFSLATVSREVLPTPVPGALPLFATALTVGGFFSWKRRRTKRPRR